ncbi:MAG TPA: hypothetical protein VJG32_12310 [Anaerolineae bacterium]|nr:hypothetical protein [Anaerolineae bacterium]
MTSKNRRTLGTVLIWIGVLVWVPFLASVTSGQELSIIPFLAAHLTGVLSGWWLRSSADRLEGIDPSRDMHGRRRKLVSRILIYLGVLAWAPYLYLERILGEDVNIAPFLAAHLTGVLGGVGLRLSVEWGRLTRRE